MVLDILGPSLDDLFKKWSQGASSSPLRSVVPKRKSWEQDMRADGLQLDVLDVELPE